MLYLHFDDFAANDGACGRRIAQGCFLLSAPAGWFVSTVPGPVLADDGLNAMRSVEPVACYDTQTLAAMRAVAA